MTLLALALASAAVTSSPATEWKLDFERADLKVYARPHEGTNVRELKAEGEFDVPPLEARAVVSDKTFTSKLPYIGEFRVVKKVYNGDTTYMRLTFPVIDDRDYFLDNVQQSDMTADGAGTYLRTFNLSAEKRPPRSGIVRIPVCEGSWELSAGSTPGKTKAVYHLMTDPGGWIPAWLANTANSRAVPNLFTALGDEMKRRHAAAPPPQPKAAPGVETAAAR